MKQTVIQRLILSVETLPNETAIIKKVLQKNESAEHSFTLQILRNWLLEFECSGEAKEEERVLEDIIDVFSGLPDNTQITFTFQ